MLPPLFPLFDPTSQRAITFPVYCNHCNRFSDFWAIWARIQIFQISNCSHCTHPVILQTDPQIYEFYRHLYQQYVQPNTNLSFEVYTKQSQESAQDEILMQQNDPSLYEPQFAFDYPAPGVLSRNKC